MNYDIIIIGSGLGGLQCAYILAKNGYKVCVLEKANLIGGCLQTFKRKGCTFDTGFHYVGSMSPGESLYKLFSYYGLKNLDFKKMDSAFDEVVIDGECYQFNQQHTLFAQELSNKFPHQKENIIKFTDFLKSVGDNIFNSLKPNENNDFYGASLFSRSAKQFIEETITDPLLQKILIGTSLKMELSEKLPLYTFAQINNSFIQSAYRLQGGGMQIAEKLAESIKQMGGELRTKAEITELVEENGELTKAVINNSETISAKWFISNAQPSHTINLVKNSEKIKKIYRRRITNMPNTFGMFTVNIKLKPNTIKYLNRNQFIYTGDADLWNYTPGKTDRILISYYKDENSEYASSLDIITPLTWEETAAWNELPYGKRGADYAEFKTSKANECLALAETYIKGITDAVDSIFTSTPLTYNSYLNSVQGTAYGLQKDFESPMLTVLTPRTPIPNLLLTGQSLNLHGFLGVSMTSLFTCAEILGLDKIVEQFDL